MTRPRAFPTASEQQLGLDYLWPPPRRYAGWMAIAVGRELPLSWSSVAKGYITAGRTISSMGPLLLDSPLGRLRWVEPRVRSMAKSNGGRRNDDENAAAAKPG